MTISPELFEQLISGIPDIQPCTTGESNVFLKIAENTLRKYKNEETEVFIKKLACDTFLQWRKEKVGLNIHIIGISKKSPQISFVNIQYPMGCKTPEEVKILEEQFKKTGGY